MSGKRGEIAVRGYRLTVIGVLAVLVMACGRQAPQRPSHRMGETAQVDSTELAMMEFNRQMAEAADKQLLQITQAQGGETYALYYGNAWVRVLILGDEDAPTPREGEEWLLHMCVYDIQEHLLLDSEQTYRIGKYELPTAIDENIGEWHRGTKVRMYVPWYSAFGRQGTAEIPPYENVIIDLELK